MNKLIEIAKANGAQVVIDLHTEDIAFTASQLLATIEQVCAPLLKDIANLSAIVRIQNGNKHQDINCLLGIADKHVSAYRALIGDKHE